MVDIIFFCDSVINFILYLAPFTYYCTQIFKIIYFFQYFSFALFVFWASSNRFDIPLTLISCFFMRLSDVINWTRTRTIWSPYYIRLSQVAFLVSNFHCSSLKESSLLIVFLNTLNSRRLTLSPCFTPLSIRKIYDVCSLNPTTAFTFLKLL